ncbi:aminotransferase class I/II-fold pyridoxal phosphate-dependent enzyme [Crenobacter cavernae]|uniref:Putative 8-amino-7-oxononanoate synthase n=2 Tax=Crenobacter cavernae TaxID=2290923 RepID=A0A345Y7N8_9NEIS|nr:aminotransferase class I/II-fold pyridoxal phosphate-dependent enzyme [Crenobacter cavernae]
MVFVQSVLHNPTGWDASAPVLHRLLTLAEHHDFLIAEDDVYGDLHPDEPLRLAQLSGLRRVIYFGSFSKVLSPAMRLGFVCAEPSIVDSLLGQRVGSVLTGSRLDELLLIHLLQSGRFRKHLARTRERLVPGRLFMPLGDARLVDYFCARFAALKRWPSLAGMANSPPR